MTTKPKPINAKRLLKLAAFLDKLPRSHFDFNTVRSKVEVTPQNTCGTVGCAIGWCPTVFPRVCKTTRKGSCLSVNGRIVNGGGFFDSDAHWAVVGERLFDMDIDDAYALFTPGNDAPNDSKSLGENATPKQVAKRIRRYVAWKQKNP